MSAPVLPEPDARLRAHPGTERSLRLHVRSLTLSGLGHACWDPAAKHPSALDYLLAALATDLLSGLGEESRRASQELDRVELRLEALLENPLVVAGVVGEQGSPRVAAIRGSLYVGSVPDEPAVRAMWQRARERSPVLATFAPTVIIDIALKFIP